MCFELFRQKGLDVIFLQELHISSRQEAKLWTEEWGGKAFWSFGTSDSCGTGILFKPNLDFKLKNYKTDHNGRLVVVDVSISGVDVSFICVYAPNNINDRKLFLNNLLQYLVGNKYVILGGDFNCVENTDLDKCGGNINSGHHGGETLVSFKQDFALVDPFRQKYPHLKEFTWFASNNSDIKCRLDRFYISDTCFETIESIVHEKFTLSDHSLVTLIFSDQFLKNNPHGPGYWKCNVQILELPEFLPNFLTLWEQLTAEITTFDGEWWDHCKVMFRKLIIDLSKTLSNKYLESLRDLEEKLKLYQDFNKVNPGAFDEKICNVQLENEELLIVKAEGSKIRSRARLLDFYEKPSKYFLMKEKARAKAKNLKRLVSSNGVIIDQNDDIISECKKFYENLYSAEPIDEAVADLFLDHVPVLSETNRELCEGQITKEECFLALSKMQNNKSPGQDGLPKEFYVKVFPIIGEKFVEMVNSCLAGSTLSPSQRHGLITLICKNTDRSESLSNWRPISLLNVDYKIVSKVLSRRLSGVLEFLVNIDQTCAVPGRSILDNVHLLRNLIDYVDQKDLPCALISLDQSKAFDRVSHKYLFKTLKAYGFGPQFISWVQLLYTDITSSVLVNGYQSEPFGVHRSVRQGCSLSPLLYVLCIEPFAIKIRCDPHIQGLGLPGCNQESRISQYADDTTCIVTTLQSITKIFVVSELYSLASGAKLNKEKSSGMWLGSWKWRKDQPSHLNWSKCLKICGVKFGNLDITSENWSVVMQKVVKSINLHKTRLLTMTGKAVIANTLFCSKLWYLGSAIQMSPEIVGNFNKAIFAFIWSNKVEKVKRSTMYLPSEEGGISLVQIESKLKAFLIKHILNLLYGDFAKWHPFAVYWIGHQLSRFKSDLGSNLIPHSAVCTAFYAECLKYFREFISLLEKRGVELKSLCSFQSGAANQCMVTTNQIYKMFLNQFPRVPHIYSVFPSINYSIAWRVNKVNFIDPNLRDLMWKILHNVLPVMAYLHRLKISKSLACCYCGAPETISHAFFKCPVVHPLWSELICLYQKFNFPPDHFPISNNSIPLHLAIFNYFPHPLNKVGSQVGIFLVYAMRHCIWHARNRKVFENRNITTQSIYQHFLNFIKFRIRADFWRYKRSKFKDYWCQNACVCCVQNGKLLLFL